MTGGVELFGESYSVYVRICRMILAEKGVTPRLVPVDVFADGGPGAGYLAINPFGRIPALRRDGFSLYESDAIAAYVEGTFRDPPLVPAGARAEARMRQLMRIADTEIYPHLVWRQYVPWSKGEDREPLDRCRLILNAVADITQTPWLAGSHVSLADIWCFAMLDYFVRIPDGAGLVSEHAVLHQWMKAMSARKSVLATAYPGA